MKKFNVIITRAKKDGKNWERILKKEGIFVSFLPVQVYKLNNKIDFSIPENPFIIFTSKRGIEYFYKIFKNSNFEAGVLGDVEEKIAKDLGFKLVLKASKPNSKSLAEEIQKKIPKERKILYPASEIHRKESIEFLKESGYEVKVLNLYKPVRLKLKKEKIDIIKNATDILFFSPSQVENFFSQISEEFLKEGVRLWAIGKTTYSFIKNKENSFYLENPTPEEFLKKLKNF